MAKVGQPMLRRALVVGDPIAGSMYGPYFKYTPWKGMGSHDAGRYGGGYSHELVQERRPARSSLRRRDHPQRPRRHPRSPGRLDPVRRQPGDHRQPDPDPDSARAITGST